MTLVNQPTNKTNRKVKLSAWTASIIAPVSGLLSAVIISQLPDEFAGYGIEVETLLIAGITGLATWGVGYWARERAA